MSDIISHVCIYYLNGFRLIAEPNKTYRESRPIITYITNRVFDRVWLIPQSRVGLSRVDSVPDLPWSIEVVERHTCPDALISCSNRGCQRSIKRKDEPTHKEECLYAVISCEQCHQNTTVANKELHLEKTCPRGEIRCPLKCRKRPRRCGHKAFYIIISNLKWNSLYVRKRKHLVWVCSFSY